VLPAGWQALGDWHPVNLDDDDDEENLLLFRFDNGQVGALIEEGDPATSISPPAYLLPRTFDDQDVLEPGVIAGPATPAGAITVTLVSGNVPARELFFFAGGTHLTFAWWRGREYGYGVTQLYAPGGFAVDWQSWQQNPAPISAVIGYYPLLDYRQRSNICDLVSYVRRTDLPNAYPNIVFSAQPQGLHFCNSRIPDYPFAPEAAVLAYLRLPRAGDARLAALLTPGATLAQLDAESAAERWPGERVVDIAAYTNAPVRLVETETSQATTTTVCVEFDETVNPSLRRWLVYTLRYQPPDAAQQLPERWTVSSAIPEPPPVVAPGPGYCGQILARNAP
jgi:hypothetical protein